LSYVTSVDGAGPGRSKTAMNIKQIEKRQKAERDKIAAKNETAKLIRKLLDEAKAKIGDDWDDEDMQTQILELVTEDE
jgi:hypothetical protein